MAEELIGKTVNGYEILRQIGQGGMARVYLARQRSMNRHAALKFLPRAFLDDEAYLARFEREARIVARLEHRNIVPVYDYGKHEDQPYLAMRYMPAGSVEALLAESRLPLPRALSIVEQVARALDYAHRKGVLHRDLKPSNILLDDAGGAFISDFGIARILSEGGGLTTEGVIGTPGYMSPEQAQGDALDGRSDVYALGLLLYEMVAGRRPFESDAPLSVAVMHVTRAPPSPRQFAPELPGAVESVIMRSLNKRPEARYQRAGELAAALRAAIDAPRSPNDRENPNRVGLAHRPEFRPPADPLPVRAISQESVANRRRPGLWLGMAAGGGLGCALLALLLILALPFLSLLSPDDSLAPMTATAPDLAGTATAEPRIDASPTSLQETRRENPLQLTLTSMSAAADASFTAAANQRSARPSATATGFQPVGLRERIPLSGALAEARGELLYFTKRLDSDADAPQFDIAIMDLVSGATRRFNAGGGSSTYPMPSPDGRWIAFQANLDGDFEIFLADRFGGQLRQLTRNAVWDRLPAWSPAGDWIVYSSDARGDQTFDLRQIRPNGADERALYADGWRNSHARYSPDGRFLVFTAGPIVRDGSAWEIRLLDLEAGASTLLTANEVRDASPTFSPDGRRILYVTSVGGAQVLASMNLAGEERRLHFSEPGRVWAGSYSLDGKFIVATSTVEGGDQLFLLAAAGGPARQITATGGAYASWLPALAG